MVQKIWSSCQPRSPYDSRFSKWCLLRFLCVKNQFINDLLLGYNHSGKLGQIDFLYGIMGMANAQRALNYIRIITEFISQPEWKDVVPTFGIVNEALITAIGTYELRGL